MPWEKHETPMEREVKGPNKQFENGVRWTRVVDEILWFHQLCRFEPNKLLKNNKKIDKRSSKLTPRILYLEQYDIK